MQSVEHVTSGIRVLGGPTTPPESGGASGQPSTIVLVHGIGTSHRYFARLHTELEADATVYSLDLPGFGGNLRPAFSPTVREMAFLVANSLDELGVRDAVLIGHSMGAQWVVELALLRPDLVSRVVIIGPVTDSEHRSLIAQSKALAVDVLGEPPLVNAVVFMDYLLCGPRYFLAQSKPMLSYPIDERVASLTQPLLVLRGGNDPIASEQWCRRLVARAPIGCLVTVPRNRHVVQFTAPKAVAGAVRAFITRTRSSVEVAQ
jgi:pimeloyl-ACP methyl ester carboxylesterase